ncbi:uncharacterized protein LOC123500144 isoform X3 [Portunus trituberculatus]|uniref:uncharacterized protein LOC123500144 isoform X3 n=1 Tax=Portunus trituberculatus TaxID=210409 RepID=UPI001E1CDC2A|nr:uncharacterized protein LOC123500144 isoform X3 [Portunus trituberculatus]
MSRISTDVIAVANKMPCYHSTVSRLLPTRSHASSCSCSILLQATSRWRHLQGPREDPGGGGDSSCHTASMANPSLVSEGPATVCSPSSLAASQPHFSTRGPFSFSSPRSKDHWQGTAEDTGRQGNSYDNSPSLANSSMVPEGPSTAGRHSSFAPSTFIDPATISLPDTSTGPEVNPGSNDLIRKSFQNQGLLPEVAGFLLNSWRKSTKAQYGKHVDRWVSICCRKEINSFSPPVNVLLDYLFLEFKKEKGRGYSSMNTLQSAISTVALINGQPAGRHLLVSRFMKAVFQEKPSFAHLHSIWDSELVLDQLKSLGQNKDLLLIQLSRKLTILMLLTSGQWGQALHLMDIRNMSISDSRISF